VYILLSTAIIIVPFFVSFLSIYYFFFLSFSLSLSFLDDYWTTNMYIDFMNENFCQMLGIIEPFSFILRVEYSWRTNKRQRRRKKKSIVFILFEWLENKVKIYILSCFLSLNLFLAHLIHLTHHRIFIQQQRQQHQY